MPRKAKSINFEQALEELDTLVSEMENGDISLEASLKHFERGIELTRTCQKALADAEQKVKILMGDDTDSPLADFDQDQLEN